MNNNITSYIGDRIRFLRRKQNISNKTMASLLGKSCSTISKYEAGAISIDIYTLYQIAEVLHVSVSDLLVSPTAENNPIPSNSNTFNSEQLLFLYYHDGSHKDISKAYLKIHPLSSQESDVYCYLDNPPFYSHHFANYVYHGTMYAYDLISYVFLTNPGNPVDRLDISFLNPLHQSQCTWGILSSILHNPIAPYITKVLISRTTLSEQDIADIGLQFTKEELKWLKKSNIILIENEK